jgi:hypothetical protein
MGDSALGWEQPLDIKATKVGFGVGFSDATGVPLV